MTNYLYRVAASFLLLGVFIAGCEKGNNPVDAPLTASAANDAAYSIAGAMGDQSGGAVESYGDLLTVQSTGSLQASVSLGKGDIETISADSGTYNPVDGWWTVTISKTRSNSRVTSSIERTYQYRFWKNDAEWQQYYVTNGDTAVKMEFKIVSGSGYFKNPILTHKLDSLQGAWLATNINRDTVTITVQETFLRSGVDSIVTHNVTRTLTHRLTINSANIKTLRFKPSMLRPYLTWRLNLPHAISGTISGHYTATITKQKDDYYSENTIDKDFTVTFNREEGGNISIGGKGGFHYNADSGERDDNEKEHD